ncbi:MAG: ASKHA domain-containing protein [Pseudomonadota bacterium]
MNILPYGIWLRVRRGVTVWEALKKTDIELEGDCGGLGTCGKCKIRVITAIGPPSPEAREHFGSDELERGIRLACRTRIKKDLVIHTETDDHETELYQILKYGDVPSVEIDPLVKKQKTILNPPSLESDLSDVGRIKEALGRAYRSMAVSPGCLVNLYHDLRATKFQGAAVLGDNRILAWEPLEKADRQYGLTFDLGTSTLVAKLIDLGNGQEMTVASRLNSQTRYGSDVISRIQYVLDHPKGLADMKGRLLSDLNLLIRNISEVSNVNPDEIFSTVIAGNTTMQHFLLGLNPAGIAEAPFSPVVTEGIILEARDVGLPLYPEGLVFVLPAKSGYIGGDLIGFILASGAADQTDRLVLGLDFGTNGEIFLGNGERMFTCSAAAGPALEGARITHGMIGKTGAIEGVRFEENGFSYRVIGNVPPKGLCGSGLVDLVALLLHHDLIDPEGLMRPPPYREKDDFISRLKIQEGKEVYDFLLASSSESMDGRTIFLTQQDVREVQLAKGAIAAGTKMLMDMMGASIRDIDEICLAGALGNYIHPLSAMRVGLLPRVDPLIINPMGNAASTGAKLALLSEEHWRKASEISRFVEHVELSSHPAFLENFVREMDFSEENLW